MIVMLKSYDQQIFLEKKFNNLVWLVPWEADKELPLCTSKFKLMGVEVGASKWNYLLN